MSRPGWHWSRRRLLGSMLAAGAAAWARPVWTAGATDAPGGVIALPRGREIALLRPDGSEDRKIVELQPGEFVADVALSPDGKRVAFGLFTARTGEGAGGSDIVIAAVEPGSERTVIVPRDRPGMLLAGPQWSPDGSALVFEAVGLSAEGKASVTTEWVLADGTGRRTVATMARYPSFAPDGASVVYTRALPTGDALWESPLDGGPGREILAETLFLVIAYPRYSPDGARIAFAGVADKVPGYQQSGTPGSGTLPPGPGAPAPGPGLTGPGGSVPKLLGGRPDADVSSLRGVLAHGFPAEPWLVPTPGGDPRPLAQLPIDDAAVAWSPDGQRVASSGATGVYLIGAADGSVQQVTEIGSFGAIDWR